MAPRPKPTMPTPSTRLSCQCTTSARQCTVHARQHTVRTQTHGLNSPMHVGANARCTRRIQVRQYTVRARQHMGATDQSGCARAWWAVSPVSLYTSALEDKKTSDIGFNVSMFLQFCCSSQWVADHPQSVACCRFVCSEFSCRMVLFVRGAFFVKCQVVEFSYGQMSR